MNLECSNDDVQRDERHDRVLRQFAVKVLDCLPLNDDDARRVLEHSRSLLENFLAIKRDGDEPVIGACAGCQQRPRSSH